MREFLRNWLILAGIIHAFSFAFPEVMRQIFGAYEGLAIVPLAMILVVVAVLPRRLNLRRAQVRTFIDSNPS